MEKNNKFSAVFGQAWCLVASITAFIVSLSTIISCFIGIFTNSGFFGVISIINNVLNILWTVPVILIGVGCMILYIKGRNGLFSDVAINMVKISVIIKGIVTFMVVAGCDIVLLVGLLISFSADPPILLVILEILIFGIIAYYSVIIFMYTFRINNILGDIRDWKKGEGFTGKNTAVYLSVMQMSACILKFVFIIFVIICSAFMKNVMDIGGGLLPFDVKGIFPVSVSGIVLQIFNLISVVGYILLFVMSIVFSSKIKKYKTGTVYIEQSIEHTEIEFGNSEGRIISLSGHDRGVCYPIKYGEEIIIGKNPYIANIIINKKFETVSRRHCGIKYDAVNDMYQVIDYSMNGTYINSVRQLCKGVYVNVPRGTIINLAKENLDYKLS